MADIGDLHDDAPDLPGEPPAEQAAAAAGRPKARRALKVTLFVVGVLAGLIVLMFAFGKPQAPVTAQASGASGAPAVSAQPDSGGDPSARGRTALAADPNTPLAIEIPGCKCHSDDPKLVEEHAQYRMNQCAGCHVNGTPTGAE